MKRKILALSGVSLSVGGALAASAVPVTAETRALRTVTRLEADVSTLKMDYYAGQQFDRKQGTVYAHYSDGSRRLVDLRNVQIVDFPGHGTAPGNNYILVIRYEKVDIRIPGLIVRANPVYSVRPYSGGLELIDKKTPAFWQDLTQNTYQDYKEVTVRQLMTLAADTPVKIRVINDFIMVSTKISGNGGYHLYERSWIQNMDEVQKIGIGYSIKVVYSALPGFEDTIELKLPY